MTQAKDSKEIDKKEGEFYPYLLTTKDLLIALVPSCN